MSGVKVIAAIFAGIALSFGLAGLGFLLFEPEASPCATGEPAENRYIGPEFETRIEDFDSVRDAGAFICHRVPVLDADGWELTHASAERTVPTEFLVQGYGIGIVLQGYEHAATGDTLVLQSAPYTAGPSYFAESMPPGEAWQPTRVQGFDARVYRAESDQLLVQWESDSMQHQVIAPRTPTLSLEALLGLMKDFG